MKLNTKPVMIEALARTARHGSPTTVVDIRRTSSGMPYSPGYEENAEIIYRDGTIEKISIKDMNTDETFITLCSMIGAHEPYQIPKQEL